MAGNSSQTYDSTNRRFDTTQWSVILQAANSASPQFASALEALCRAYWLPLYSFMRKTGRSSADACDLTQGFFAYLLEKRIHSKADRERGKFRTFLLAALKRYLSSTQERESRLKRGGGAAHVSLDVDAVEEYYGRELVEEFSPEQMFDRQWANLVFDQVLEECEREYAAAGQSDRFVALRTCLMTPEEAAPYAELAPRLGLSEDGVKSAAHRLRKRFRELFRARLACLVDDPSEVDAEIRHVIAALGTSGGR